MGRNSAIFASCAALLIVSTLAFATNISGNTEKTIELSVVNTSHKTLCIEDQQGEQCTSNQSAQFNVVPEYFYQRDGVIRVSLDHHDLKIAMLKKNITSASLRIDNAGNIQTESGTFEKGSFVYSDNKDYLYFVVKPYDLFGAYPIG